MEAAIVDGAHRVADGASNLAHEAAHLAHLDGGDRREPLTDADGILAAGGSASAAPEPQSQPQADSRSPPSYSSTTVAATQPYERSQMPVQPQAQMQTAAGAAIGRRCGRRPEREARGVEGAVRRHVRGPAAVRRCQGDRACRARAISRRAELGGPLCGQAASSGAASSYYIVPSMPAASAGVAVGRQRAVAVAEPLSLPVYDVTADLAFLCNNSPEQRAVGRVVVPLTQLLPLNPPERRSRRRAGRPSSRSAHRATARAPRSSTPRPCRARRASRWRHHHRASARC